MMVWSWMLKDHRQYVIEQIKDPLRTAVENLSKSKKTFLSNLFWKYELIKQVIALAKKYPEPTYENTMFPNTHLRLEIRDEFRKHLKARLPLIDAAFRVLIDECEHDGFYEWIHDRYIVMLLNRGWRPTEREFPMWKYWDGSSSEDYLEYRPRVIITK